MRELYVYYRVPATATARTERELAEMQTFLRAAHPGLRARWLRQPAEAGDMQTWMETYAVDPGVAPEGIDSSLEQAIESAAAERLTGIAGPRHVEVFLACAS